jgi:hypothetical protein
MIYLTSTFSPMMVSEGLLFQGREVSLEEAAKLADGATSAVSHEVTAKVLSVLLDSPVEFRRVNLTLEEGDLIICVIPTFRASESREFTREEIEVAGYRCFVVVVYASGFAR